MTGQQQVFLDEGHVTPLQIKRATQYAWSMVGTPYKLGGNVPQDGGMDCSAFGLELLRYLRLWDTQDATCQMILDEVYISGIGRILEEGEEIQEGDFLFFGKSVTKVTHMGYGIGEGDMIEAGGTDKTGLIRPRSIQWRKDLLAAVRFR